MTWSLTFPNLLVGLREGLEAGLVVTILIGAVRRLAPQRSLAAVWIGVGAATVLSLSFGAVLTFTRAEMSPRAQEIFGGATSLLAVVLVTAMIFWMRRAARGMAGELRSRVDVALASGGTALVVTAFVSVAREGLEAALFVWTNAQAAGSSTSPLLGALIGLVIAAALCVALYRRVVTINLGRFFTVTGAILIVIVAGVLAYAVTDLQDAAVLPGLNSVAFDVSSQLPTGRWWSETIRGITNLNNRMSWLQVAAYVGYLVVVMSLFFAPRRTRAEHRPAAAAPPRPEPADREAAPPTVRRSRGGRGVLVTALLAVPVVAAVTWVALDHQLSTTTTAGAQLVTLTDTTCGADWTQPTGGATTFTVRNQSTHAVDVELVAAASQGVVAEIEVLGPGTTRELPASLANAAYQWKCIYAGAPTTVSATYRVGAGGTTQATVPLHRATTTELQPVLNRYRRYVHGQLDRLVSGTRALTSALVHHSLHTAQERWRAAYLTYHRIGAAYDAFGAAGDSVDGLASGLPRGRRDPGFTGFHRIEARLWSAHPDIAGLVTQARALQSAVQRLYRLLPTFTFDANDVTIRAHEIIEDTVRFVLTGQSDYGCGCGYVTARADLTGDRTLVDLLAPALSRRDPQLVPAIHRDMQTLAHALARAVASGRSVTAAPRSISLPVDAATSQLAETLAPIPDLLEIKNP